MVKVENLSYSYGANKVLKNINLSIDKQDFCFIIGSNGAGKSTLLNLLSGSLALREGNLLIDNKTNNFTNIAYVKQKSDSNFPTTIKELVFSALYKGFLKFANKSDKDRAYKVIERVGLKGLENRLISSLSGGQLQRAMIARALLQDAKILLLDEPTSGIDSKSVDSIFQLLKEINKERTIIVVTHDLQMSVKYASKIYCIEDGNMLLLPKNQLKHELLHKHSHEEEVNKCKICEVLDA